MRNLRRDKRFTGLVDRLTEEKDAETGQAAFPTLRELMCFSAVLGYQTEHRIPLGDDAVDFVEGRVFPRSDVAVDLLYLIALAAERTVEVVQEEAEEQSVRIFEEYANGGFKLLEEWLAAQPRDGSPIRTLMLCLQRDGFLGGSDVEEGAVEDITF